MKNTQTFIIAEAGANHNRNKILAVDLIRAAIKAKANAVKFQTYSSETLYSKDTPDFAGYKNINKLIKDIELPRNWQSDLKLYCDDNGIEFMSTPFDERAVDELYEIGVKRFKIAGFEATDPRFVKYVASTGLPLIISLGIGTHTGNWATVRETILSENRSADITFLHCNHSYPTPYEDINLGQMKLLEDWASDFNIKVGLSDHTEGILVPPIAVALGAQVIEKHYTINRNLPGPDHSFAIKPKELIDMVKNIRAAETMLNIKTAKYTGSEKSFVMATRSVVIKSNVKKGDMITLDNVTTKRPLLENSIPASQYYDIIGKRFNKNLESDSILKEYDIESA